MGFDLENLGVLTETVEKSNLREAAIFVLAGIFFENTVWGLTLAICFGT